MNAPDFHKAPLCSGAVTKPSMRPASARSAPPHDGIKSRLPGAGIDFGPALREPHRCRIGYTEFGWESASLLQRTKTSTILHGLPSNSPLDEESPDGRETIARTIGESRTVHAPTIVSGPTPADRHRDCQTLAARLEACGWRLEVRRVCIAHSIGNDRGNLLALIDFFGKLNWIISQFNHEIPFDSP